MVRQKRRQVNRTVFRLKNKKTTTAIGRKGEDIAADWLAANDYTIVARNYRKRFGEVDIIARQGEWLVFIEVKTRSSDRFGSPQDSVTVHKQQQLSRIANDYLACNGLVDLPCRFDVVSVLLSGEQPPRVDVIVNAFEFIE